jgi:type IV secretion system protein TrbL
LSLDSILAGLAILPAAALVLLSFGAMAVYFVMVKIQTFIAMGATIVFLGFGGSEFTRSWVYKYIDLGISSGVKLMLIYFLVGAGWNLATAWIVAAQTAATSPSGVISCWIILIGALCYAAIAIGVPQYAAGLLSGNASLGHGEAVAIGSAGAGMAASAVMTASGMGVFGSGGAAAAAGASIAGASSPSPAPTAPPSSPPGGSSNGSGGGAYAGSAPAGGIISGMGGEFAGPA